MAFTERDLFNHTTTFDDPAIDRALIAYRNQVRSYGINLDRANMQDEEQLLEGLPPHYNRGKEGYFNMAPHLKAELERRKNEPVRLLDIGCGGGRAIHEISQEYPNVEAWGVNLRDLASSQDLVVSPDRIFKGTVRTLPEGTQFDMVLAMLSCVNSQTLLADGVRVLDRHLAPGGQFTMVDIPFAYETGDLSWGQMLVIGKRIYGCRVAQQESKVWVGHPELTLHVGTIDKPPYKHELFSRI